MTFEEFWTNGGVSTFAERTRFDLQNLKNKDEVELNQPAQSCPLSTPARGFIFFWWGWVFTPVVGGPTAPAGNMTAALESVVEETEMKPGKTPSHPPGTLGTRFEARAFAV